MKNEFPECGNKQKERSQARISKNIHIFTVFSLVHMNVNSTNNKLILIRSVHPPKKLFILKGPVFTHKGTSSSHHFYLADTSNIVSSKFRQFCRAMLPLVVESGMSCDKKHKMLKRGLGERVVTQDPEQPQTKFIVIASAQYLILNQVEIYLSC